MNRREFLQATAATVALSGMSAYGAEFADQKKRVGLMGAGWYGKADLLRLIQVAPVEVVSLCDVDKSVNASIRAVSFDVGGTLIAPWPSVERVYAEVAAEHGCPGLSEDLLQRQFKAAWAARSGFGYSLAEWRLLVEQTYGGTTAAERIEEIFPSLYRRFSEPGCWRVYSDVRSVLAVLSARGMRLAVTSNWDERLRPLLAKLNLAHHFDVVVVSGEERVHKPDRRLFLRTCTELGLPPSDVLHVGDSWGEDVEGARSAGLSALYVPRHGGLDQPRFPLAAALGLVEACEEPSP